MKVDQCVKYEANTEPQEPNAGESSEASFNVTKPILRTMER